MGGDLSITINRDWDRADRANYCHKAWFYDFYRMVSLHSSYSIISYGYEGAVEGTSDPSWSWTDKINDDEPWGTSNDNVFFVFRADNASSDLMGGTSRLWEAKVQMATSSFDDPSGSDYGNEGLNYMVCIRFSPDGGWSDGSIDFAPSGGTDVSGNYEALYGNLYSYSMHLVADDDTIMYFGKCNTANLSSLTYTPIMFGYLGEVKRAHSGIAKPEVSFITDTTATGFGLEDGLFVQNGSAGNKASFSLAPDGTTGITSNEAYGPQREHLDATSTCPFNGGRSFMPALFRQTDSTTPCYELIGEMRFLKFTGGSGLSAGDVIGDTYSWLQCSRTPGTYGGAVIPWLTGETPT